MKESKTEAIPEAVASNSPLDPLEEATPSKFLEMMRSYPCGIVSAYRDREGACDRGRQLALSEKRERHRQLLDRVRDLGYSATEGFSRHLEDGTFVLEQSVFISDEEGVGDLKNQLRILANHFHQESYLYTNLEEQLFCLEGLTNCEGVFVIEGELLQTQVQKILWAAEGKMFYTQIGARQFFYQFGNLEKLLISGARRVTGAHAETPGCAQLEVELGELYERFRKEYEAREACGWSPFASG